MSDLVEKKCVPCEGGVKPLAVNEVKELLKELDNWNFDEKNHKICKKFTFKNFYHTMNFVNAIAYLANKENHHPDMEISYNFCIVNFMTHAIGGLSQNDFICAAKIDNFVKI